MAFLWSCGQGDDVFLGQSLKTKMLGATSDLPDHKSYLHQLYVDDNNAIMEGLPPGTRMIGGKYNVMEELVAEDEQREADERTANLVMELANTISHWGVHQSQKKRKLSR